VLDYTHRDRRAQRDVSRAFFAMVAVTVALIGFALEVPLWFAGLVSVIALGALGVGYVGWADGVLEGYANDLRSGLEGDAAGGLLRAELRSSVGLDRDVGQPTARSPHARRRSPETSDSHDEPRAGAGTNSGQP